MRQDIVLIKVMRGREDDQRRQDIIHHEKQKSRVGSRGGGAPAAVAAAHGTESTQSLKKQKKSKPKRRQRGRIEWRKPTAHQRWHVARHTRTTTPSMQQAAAGRPTDQNERHPVPTTPDLVVCLEQKAALFHWWCRHAKGLDASSILCKGAKVRIRQRDSAMRECIACYVTDCVGCPAFLMH